MMRHVGAAQVAAWRPGIHIVTGTLATDAAGRLRSRLCEAFEAPALRFDPPQPLLVTGRLFATVTQAGGLVEGSVHLLGRFRWSQAFAGIDRVQGLHGDAARPPLVVANAGHDNYYHWTVQCLAAMLAHRALADAPAHFVLPVLAGWRQDSMALFGIDNPTIPLGSDMALALDHGGLTNLTGGDFAFAPHPFVLELFRAQGARIAGTRRGGRSLYLSRKDAPGKRAMANEDALIALLAARGFEIVTAGALPLAEQIALFREAALIVAPHGAALTGLVYVEDGAAGPHVIELMQQNYTNRCFAKIGQAKRLRYDIMVNPLADPGTHHHNSTWSADLATIARLLDGL